MLWYVMQTRTGEEEKLAGLVRKMVPGDLYGECFVVYQEQLWKRKQKNVVHIRRAFPGYVFITSREPEALFFCLKQVPAMSKMIADDECFFLSVEKKESKFLRQIMDENHVIGLSYLSTDGNGKIRQVSGPLESCVPQLVRCRFGKRHVLVRLSLLGKEKTVLLGIILNEDICQELRYGKVEAPVKVPEQYQIKASGKGEKMAESPVQPEMREFAPGDLVVVTSGTFEGMSGVVYKVENRMVRIGIRLLGRDMEMEISLDDLRRCGD